MTGGTVFGYDNVEVTEGGERQHVERRINSEQAAIVHRIFQMAAQGLGYRKIALQLNGEGVSAPRPRRAHLPQSWCPSSVREILHRELYRGMTIWGRVKKRDSWGMKKYLEQPDDKWLRVPTPHLQVVSDELWSTVQERLAGSKDAYLKCTQGRPGGRPVNGTESRYLLSGLAECAHCSGTMIVTSRDYKRHGRRFFLRCAANYMRGRTVCTNNLEVPMEAADRGVLGAIKHDLLRPRIVEAAIGKALERLRPQDDFRREAALSDLTRVEAEIARYTAAIGAGGDLPSVIEALRQREGRRAHLKAELASLDQMRSLGEGELAHLEAELRARLADWRALLQRHPREARQILRKLLVGRLVFSPETNETGRFYRFTGQATLGRLLAGEVLSKLSISVVTPAGFEPAISTLKGSRPWPG